MTCPSKSLFAFSALGLFAGLGLTSTPSFAAGSIEFKSFFCTTALNAPSGITTITFTGRNPLNGKNTFQMNNNPVLGLPFTQSLILEDFEKSGATLQLNFRAPTTNADFTLKMNSDTNSIQLSAGGLANLEMTCHVKINFPD